MRKLGDNFIETYELYQNGEIPDLIMGRIKSVVIPDVELDLSSFMDIYLEVGSTDFPTISQDYSDYLGGDFFLVEAVGDLSQIEFADFELVTGDGKWPNLGDHSGAFDICDWLDPERSYVEVLMIWANDGGPVFFIPAEYVTDNVLKSIEYTRN